MRLSPRTLMHAGCTQSLRHQCYMLCNILRSCNKGSQRRFQLCSKGKRSAFQRAPAKQGQGEVGSRTSTITRGWVPSLRYRSACFMSSPMSSTVDVVPSLQPAAQRLRQREPLHSLQQPDSLGIRPGCLPKQHWPDAPRYVILGDCSSRNHHCRGVLYLHLAQQHIAVLCELYICNRAQVSVIR